MVRPETLKPRREEEYCNYCYHNRVAYEQYNTTTHNDPFGFFPVDPDLYECFCSANCTCWDKSCSFYYRKTVDRKTLDPDKKPKNDTQIRPDDPSVQEVIWTGRDPELLGLKTLTLVHKDLKRSNLVEYTCVGCGELSYQLAKQIRRGIKSRGLTEFYCTTACASKYRKRKRNEENAA